MRSNLHQTSLCNTYNIDTSFSTACVFCYRTQNVTSEVLNSESARNVDIDDKSLDIQFRESLAFVDQVCRMNCLKNFVAAEDQGIKGFSTNEKC